MERSSTTLEVTLGTTLKTTLGITPGTTLGTFRVCEKQEENKVNVWFS